MGGIAESAAVWKGAGWIIVALVSVVVLAAAGGALTARRMAALAQGVAGEKGALSGRLRARPEAVAQTHD